MILQARKSLTMGVRLSDTFYALLKELDPACDALLDPDYVEKKAESSLLILPVQRSRGAIHVTSERKAGLKVHEITVARLPGESNGSLESRTIDRMKKSEAWSKGGVGKVVDKFDENCDKQLKEELEADRKKRLGELLDTEGDELSKMLKNIHGKIGTNCRP